MFVHDNHSEILLEDCSSSDNYFLCHMSSSSFFPSENEQIKDRNWDVYSSNMVNKQIR